ncbi:MAG: 50S ribosomal protein L28 [Bacilli bacterium]
MARYCPVSGKGPLSGNKRSHSLRATRRRWGVNLQNFQVEVDGKIQTVKMSARAYRSLNKSARG